MLFRGAVVVMAALSLSGCVNLRMRSSADNVLLAKKEKDVSVKARAFDGIRAKLVRTSPGKGEFSLVCRGSYEVTQECSEEGKRLGADMLSVGFFPGIFALSDGARGASYSKWPAVGIMTLVMNAGLCGFPTIASLVYEPFDSFHGDERGSLSWLAAQGLVGCCKWRRSEHWSMDVRNKSRGSRIVTDYALTDYEISIAGVRYACVSPRKRISVSVPPGKAVVSVRIERVPSLPGELDRFVASLSGVDLEVDVQ